jgi:hypothetical protein
MKGLLGYQGGLPLTLLLLLGLSLWARLHWGRGW